MIFRLGQPGTSSIRSYGTAYAAPDSCNVILHPPVATTIRTACPTCGLVDMEIGEVTVLVSASGSSAGYAYQCPSCLDRVEVSAAARVLGVLYDIGARVALSNQLPSADAARQALQPVIADEARIQKFQLALDRTDNIAGAIEQTADGDQALGDVRS